jgi:asparagine synthase (glutamine-hydrolysing)
VEKICIELRNLFYKNRRKNLSDCLLLSGGLDSSLLASIFRPVYTITVALGSEAPDLFFAKLIAKMFSSIHYEIILTIADLLEITKQVIIILRTFDPIEIRNSSVMFAGLREARQRGYRTVMTGDGGDELFAGYNYLKRYYSDEEALKNELNRLWNLMHFSSVELGNKLGVSIKTPFLDHDFLVFAQSIPVSMKVGKYQERLWGKFILRKCFQTQLGEAISWRPKLAQENGAGISKIETYFRNTADDETFATELKYAKLEGVAIRSEEHLKYYKIFKEFFGLPRDELCSSLPRCPRCQGCFRWKGNFCRTCGAYPVTPT